MNSAYFILYKALYVKYIKLKWLNLQISYKKLFEKKTSADSWIKNILDQRFLPLTHSTVIPAYLIKSTLISSSMGPFDDCPAIWRADGEQ